MPREVLLEQEEMGGGRPDDERKAGQVPRVIAVSLSMGTSGTRTVMLPVEAVDGRTVREVVNAAADALRQGGEPDRLFGDNLLEMFADSSTAVHRVLGPDQDQPLTRSQRVSVNLGQPLIFSLYTDHVGGMGAR